MDSIEQIIGSPNTQIWLLLCIDLRIGFILFILLKKITKIPLTVIADGCMAAKSLNVHGDKIPALSVRRIGRQMSTGDKFLANVR